MRDILFRGKRINDGKWMYGLLDDENHGADFTAILPHRNDAARYDSWRVDPDTVGQYTGLQDKNGKPIFEGDICRICRGYEICTAVVEYKEDIASFIWRCNEKEMLLPIDMRVAQNKAGDAVWVEVIGNIHDNPELMGGANHG